MIQRCTGPVVALSIALATATTGPARADDKQACVDDHEAGQVARRAGKLVDARALFVRCARPECPGVLQEECAAWLAEVEAELPTVVLDIRDTDGRSRPDAALWIDGQALGADSGGRALPLDPGAHSIRARLSDGRTFQRDVVVRAGQKLQAIRLDMPMPASPAPSPARPVTSPPRTERESAGGPPALTYVFGGVALAALGSFATFAILGKDQQATLEADCGKPGSCISADIDARYDPMRRSYVVADVSLAIGVAALAGAGLVWALR